MKKTLLFAWLFISPLLVPAQADTIPNAGFESWWWFGGWGPVPGSWTVNNSQLLAANVLPDTGSHSGSFAMMLINSGNFRPFASCGFPLLHHPITMTGFVKNQLNFGDSALIRIHIFQNGLLTDSAYQVVTGGIIFPGYFPIAVAVSQNFLPADSCEIILEGGNSYLSQISFDDLSLTFSTGTEEIPETNLLVCYPIPCRDRLNVFWNGNHGDAHILLRDVTGRTVAESLSPAEKGRYVLDVSDLPAGLYLLSREQGNKSVTKKILKY